MSEDDLSPAQHADIAALVAEVDREAARVGVDWQAAAPVMRTLARAAERHLSEDEFEISLSLDVTGMLATLRALPDAAGTAAFLTAFQQRQAGTSPTST